MVLSQMAEYQTCSVLLNFRCWRVSYLCYFLFVRCLYQFAVDGKMEDNVLMECNFHITRAIFTLGVLYCIVSFKQENIFVYLFEA